MRYDVLGPLRVVGDDGAEVAGLAPQQRALLAALLQEAGRTVSAAALVDSVWGPDVSGSAATSLQVIVSRLRKRLGAAGGGQLVTVPPGYRLQAGADDVDALRFGALLTRARERLAQDALQEARADVGAALSLWRGRPYADVRDDVVDAEVTRLLALRTAAVELAAEVDLALGRHAEVAERLLPEVSEQPLQEGLRGSLVTALYRCGEQARALEVYDEGRRLLADELGIDPSPQLQRLYALVLRQDPALDAPVPRPAPMPPPAPPARAVARGDDAPPAASRPAGAEAGTRAAVTTGGQRAPAADGPVMVGRDAELQACVAAWRAATDGRPGLLVLVGEAGIGKTRLAEELGRVVVAHGGRTAWGRCLDATGSAPYAPWRQVVQALAAARGPEATAQATAGRGAGAALLLDTPGETARDASGATPRSGGSPEAARTHLFEGVTAYLEAMAAAGPLAVVVEDLHWADPETVLLTEHVAQHLAAVPLCLVLTVRDPAGSSGTDRPGDRVLAVASRLPAGVRVDLTGLSAADIQRYAVQSLDVPVALDVARRLHDRTNGNPFFIAELVRLLDEERSAHGRADVEVPRSVQAVLERRLVHLGPDLRAVLAAAAVLGRDFDVRLLAGVLGRTPVDLVDALDTAVAAGVLRAVPGGRPEHQFTHALVQEVLLAATGPMRRAALHARAADVLAQQHAGALERVAGQLAFHRVAAGSLGDPEGAVRACLLAAEVAEAEAAHAEAEQHLRTALEQLTATSGSTALQLELEVRVRLGSLLTLLHGYSGAAVAGERRRALELVAQVGTAEHALSALWGAWGVALVSGDFAAAEAAAFELATAAQRRDGDDVLLLAHHHALGQVRLHQGRLTQARDHLLRADTLTREHGDRVSLAVFLQHPAVTAPAWLAFVLTLLGEEAQAQERSEQARLAALRLGHDYTSAYRTILEGWRAVFLRQPEEVLRVTEAGMAISREQGFDQLLAFALGPHGWGLAHRRDDPTGSADGVAEAERGLELFGALPDGHMFGHLMLGALAESLAAAGRDGEAADAAARAVTEAGRTGEVFFLPAAHLQLAALAELTGAGPDVVGAHRAAAAGVVARTGAQGLLGRAASVPQGAPAIVEA